MHEVVHMEKLVPLLRVLHAAHGTDLRRYLRMIALDAVVAEQDDALAIRDQLPLEVGIYVNSPLIPPVLRGKSFCKGGPRSSRANPPAYGPGGIRTPDLQVRRLANRKVAVK